MVKKITASIWGGSIGVRLPKKMVEELNIENGTELTAELRGGKIILYTSDYKPAKSDKIQEAIELLSQTLPKSKQ